MTYDIPAAPGGPAGGLVTRTGQLQYGDMLLGGGSAARWRTLTGWHDLPAAQLADSPRPQAHGVYPGSVLGDALTVTFDYLLRCRTLDEKQAAIAALERYAPMDGVERPLVVDDGDGPWFRQARVIARTIPQDHMFKHAPLQCSIQFLCSDPRRYALAERSGTVTLPSSSGGLEYPLDYPLAYGASTQGGMSATNGGTVATPLVATFVGPLTNPRIVCPDWRLGFNITLADGETLAVDTGAGSAVLNDTADRLYTLMAGDSDPLERCVLQPGITDLTLIADAGVGQINVSYHDARM